MASLPGALGKTLEVVAVGHEGHGERGRQGDRLAGVRQVECEVVQDDGNRRAVAERRHLDGMAPPGRYRFLGRVHVGQLRRLLDRLRLWRHRRRIHRDRRPRIFGKRADLRGGGSWIRYCLWRAFLCARRGDHRARLGGKEYGQGMLGRLPPPHAGCRLFHRGPFQGRQPRLEVLTGDLGADHGADQGSAEEQADRRQDEPVTLLPLRTWRCGHRRFLRRRLSRRLRPLRLSTAPLASHVPSLEAGGSSSRWSRKTAQPPFAGRPPGACAGSGQTIRFARACPSLHWKTKIKVRFMISRRWGSDGGVRSAGARFLRAQRPVIRRSRSST